MFALTRKTDYALVALAAMARSGADVFSARDLSQRLRLPLPVLRNILKHLAHAGLLSATRGQQGGYALARPPQHVTLADLIEAMEGPMRLTLCCRDEPQAAIDGRSCEIEGTCEVREPVRRVHRLMRQLLGGITLAQIADGEVPREVSAVQGETTVCSCGGHEMPQAAAAPDAQEPQLRTQN